LPLYAYLMIGVLFFCLSQPFVSVIRGNNLLKAQFYTSLVSAILAVGLVVALVPVFGIEGAAMAIALTEIVACAITAWAACRFLSGVSLSLSASELIAAFVNAGLCSLISLLNAYAVLNAPLAALAIIGLCLVNGVLLFRTHRSVLSSLLARVRGVLVRS
ncbi:MAG: polysaccharide biosynthesis C-terminal domain-containing protein, partial [Asticcacaulis sp.]